MIRLTWSCYPDPIPAVYRGATDAQHILQRHDRVIWYLRLTQRDQLDCFVNSPTPPTLTPAQRRKHQRLLACYGRAWPERPGINEGYQFLRIWEKAVKTAKEAPWLARWLEETPITRIGQFCLAANKVKALICDALTLKTHQQLVDDFITFPDGWKWVLCRYSGSTWEGRLLHHCGNMGTKDLGCRLLSLREPIRRGGAVFWKPHLTFTYTMTCIGEMKGRGNTKPASRYFPYIRTLFLDKRVTALASHLGSLPERDLAWEDLPTHMRRELEQKRLWIFHSLREAALDRHINPPPPDPPPLSPTRWSRFKENLEIAGGLVAMSLPVLLPFGYFLFIVGRGILNRYILGN
ncbi:MAG: hypothetical protein K9M98_06940 [Cephaloticoccus sp.]|nr:hypothetical protein [Cephaloticoccus sp.]MCF7760225.1 hypothetical protein [Cephaloticoccus sp.]